MQGKTAKLHLILALLILGGTPLVGCAGTPTGATPTAQATQPQATPSVQLAMDQPTTPAAGQPTASPCATPGPGPATPTTGQTLYLNSEGGFSFGLPAGWTVGDPQKTALGSLYPLGPAPLGRGPRDSAILVADSASLTPEKVAAQLCGAGVPLRVTSVSYTHLTLPTKRIV